MDSKTFRLAVFESLLIILYIYKSVSHTSDGTALGIPLSGTSSVSCVFPSLVYTRFLFVSCLCELSPFYIASW